MSQPVAHRPIRTAIGSLLWLAILSLSATLTFGQTQSSIVPRLVKFSGTVSAATGTPRSSVVGLTFALYKDQQGGAPLWLETQSAALDSTGHYTVQLGATLPTGLPQDLFASGEARWLGVQPEGQAEQPRVLLLSVPYALKAADAETIGGLPPSAFVLATPQTVGAASTQSHATTTTSVPPPNAAVTGAGTVNTIPLWDSTSDIINSAITQSGTGATAKIGINTTAPASTLDVKGTGTVRGTLTLPSTGPATAAAGKASQPLALIGTSFNSGTATSVNQTFRLQTEPAGNNTATNSGTLNLLYATGTNAAAETGFKIASNGQITFAPGQIFPGTGPGTITGVTAGSGLTGGGTTGTVSLNLDTTKIPQLSVANIFTANQTITGNLTTSGSVTATSFNASGTYNLGGAAFAFGSSANSNAALGFAGSLATTGTHNTGVGVQALSAVTAGAQNTGVGAQALDANTTGNNNTAIGQASLLNNTTGSSNTALGFQAGPDASHLALTNAAAIGANAVVSESNALVLGGTGANAVNVGIGTATPASTLDVHGTANFTGPITFASGQTFPGAGTITGVTAGTALTGGGTTGGVTLNVDTTKVVTGITAGTGLTGGGTGGLQTLNLDTTKVPELSTANTFTGIQTMNGNLIATTVGIGVATPLAALHIDHVSPSGGQDTVMVTSGKSTNVSSLLIQNTASGGLRLREGAGTGSSYLASSGSLSFMTSDTGTPSNPVPAAMTIDTTGRVGIGIGLVPLYPLHVTGEIRGEGGLSLSSSGPFNVDKAFIPGGRLTILSNGNVGINNANPQSILDVVGNGSFTGGLTTTGSANIGTTLSVLGNAGVGGSIIVNGDVIAGGTVDAPAVSIDGDTPLHAAPHMFITGFFPGNIGINETAAYVIPSRSIIITRMSYKLGTSAILCPVGGTLSISYDSTGTPIYSMGMGSSFTADSGAINFPIAASTPLILTVSSAPVCPPAGGVANAAVSVEYVMQ